MARPQYTLRLMETFRTVFYTPIYVTVAGGFLESEGLDVTFSTCPGEFPHPLSALNHQAADIVQSGIMRSIIAADWGAETVPRHFAEINARDGFFVLSREPQADFQWSAFEGSTVIPVGFSPMPWASFRFALRRHGVSLESLSLLHGLSLDQAIEAFRQGRASFIHLPQPAAEELITEGLGSLVVALGPENGHLAYSSFAATNQFLAGHAEVVDRFVQGYSRALQWLAQSPAATVGEAVGPFFPGLASDTLTDSIQRYQSQDTWPADPFLGQPEYDGLQEILMAAGMVKEYQPYEKVVTTEFASGGSG